MLPLLRLLFFFVKKAKLTTIVEEEPPSVEERRERDTVVIQRCRLSGERVNLMPASGYTSSDYEDWNTVDSGVVG